MCESCSTRFSKFTAGQLRIDRKTILAAQSNSIQFNPDTDSESINYTSQPDYKSVFGNMKCSPCFVLTKRIPVEMDVCQKRVSLVQFNVIKPRPVTEAL